MTNRSSTTPRDSAQSPAYTSAGPSAAASDKHASDKPATEQAKEKVQQATADAQAKADQASTQVKQTVSEVTADVKRQASSTLHQVEDQAVDMAETRKDQAAGRLHDVAGALRKSSEDFRRHEDDAFAGYTDMAADQVEHFAAYLEERNAHDLWRGMQDFARSQPEIFIAGSLAAGFFLGRFLKSTQESKPRAQSNDSAYGNARTSRYQTGRYQTGGYQPSSYPSGQYTADRYTASQYATGQYPDPAGQTASSPYASRQEGNPERKDDSTYREPQESHIGATAYNGERAQSGAAARGTGATGSETDWGADYNNPELSNSTRREADKSANQRARDYAERKGE